jgi:hypothetical protein
MYYHFHNEGEKQITSRKIDVWAIRPSAMKLLWECQKIGSGLSGDIDFKDLWHR